jgi:hypothetical protein
MKLAKKIAGRVLQFSRSLLTSAYQWQDYSKYKNAASSFIKIAKNLPSQDKGSLLIVSGKGMNVMWAQVWSIFSLAVRMHGYKGLVLTTHSQTILNRYFRLLQLDLLYYDDLTTQFAKSLPEIAIKVQNAVDIQDYRNIFYNDIPVGEIAVSTYSRYYATGFIQLNDVEVVKKINEWIFQICQAGDIADHIYKKFNVKILYVAEIFSEEYGAFYYRALSKKINIIKFTGTVRDDAFIFQHLASENARLHHASLSQSLWEKIKLLPYTENIDTALTQNFIDRYSNKWHRSKRNYPGTKIMTVEEARMILGVKPGRKVAVIYSHILYDTIFFFGTDLFSDYSTWLVETVRVACQNTDIDWLVKVHPSNLWRGELNTLLKGKYEEERLIEGALGKLPAHVRIVPAETKINPYTWFQLADYGITVRGTSGLEMAALGKTVITAGTGRYEGNGFTIDMADKDAYLDLLKKLPNIPSPSTEQVELAKRYAYALFVLKPFVVNSLLPTIRSGIKKVVASDDIVYIPGRFAANQFPLDFQNFSKWAMDKDNLELLSEWGVK